MTELEISNGSDEMEEMSMEEKEVMATLLEENPDDDCVDSADEEEMEISNLIRIRENIFETEDDDEEDSDYDFPIPEVEIHTGGSNSNSYSSTPIHSRKRKQVINFRPEQEISLGGGGGNGSIEFVEIEDDHDMNDHGGGDSNGYNSEKRNRLPLYLLNPDDYGHDPKKQAQIRRAIITYRHHQEKKTQIIKLTEENVKLRAHTEALKLKLLEVSSCGCDKNSNVNLDVLDVIIPEVPPRMYVRGNKTVLAAPYHKVSFPPTEFTQPDTPSFTMSNIKTEYGASPSTPPVTSAGQKQTNVVITRSRSLGNNGIVQTQSPNTRPAATAAASGSQTPTISKGILNGGVRPQRFLNGGVRLQGNQVRVVTAVTPSRNQVVMSTVKTEPGTVPLKTVRLAAPPTTTEVASVSTSQKTASSNSSSSPATATPVSRIVFANKATSSSNAVQTASQLVFGAKAAAAMPQPPRPTVRAPVPGLIAAPTASQLALGAKLTRPVVVPTTTGPFTSPLNFLGGGNGTGASTIFRTANGQVLRLVSSAPQVQAQAQVALQQPKPATASQFKLIKPKPIATSASTSSGSMETIELEKDSIVKEMEKREFEELWRQFARKTGESSSDSDDEPQVVNAITGVSPPPMTMTTRNRKQTMATRQANTGKGNNASTATKGPVQVLRAGNSIVELNKYADIVFEEC